MPRRLNSPAHVGIIIAASIVVAAGIAVYENPHVREWVNNSRRKIAVALHNLGDEINPRLSPTQESSQPTAAGGGRSRNAPPPPPPPRRERGDWAEKQDDVTSKPGFDALLKEDGSLKDEHAVRTTGTDDGDDEGLLRRRMDGVRGLNRGSVINSSFLDEDDSQVLLDKTLVGANGDEWLAEQGARTPRQSFGASSTSDRPFQSSPWTDTKSPTSSTLLDNEQEPLVQLATDADSSQNPLQPETLPPHALAPEDWSMSDWEGSTTASNYASVHEDQSSDGMSTPPAEDNSSPAASPATLSAGSSNHGHDDAASLVSFGDDSDVGGVGTPESWSEIGSVVSEDDHRQ
ncbi:MAG: hypothetical protein M1819_004666 [Sarea resinae]|nr:MAG: hypothetical protein M1819_004666 [Sarea resinae]